MFLMVTLYFCPPLSCAPAGTASSSSESPTTIPSKRARIGHPPHKPAACRIAECKAASGGARSLLCSLLEDVLPPVSDLATQAGPPALSVAGSGFALWHGRLVRRGDRDLRLDLCSPLLPALPLLTPLRPVACRRHSRRRLDRLRRHCPVLAGSAECSLQQRVRRHRSALCGRFFLGQELALGEAPQRTGDEVHTQPRRHLVEDQA